MSVCSNLFINHASCIASLSCLPFFIRSLYASFFMYPFPSLHASFLICRIFYLLVIIYQRYYCYDLCNIYSWCLVSSCVLVFLDVYVVSLSCVPWISFSSSCLFHACYAPMRSEGCGTWFVCVCVRSLHWLHCIYCVQKLWREKQVNKPICKLAQAYPNRVRLLCVPQRHKKSQRRACTCYLLL